MIPRRPLALALTLSTVCALAPLPAAAQKGKPPASVPGTFVIRTPVYDMGAEPNADRVTGDGLPLASPGIYAGDADGTSVVLNGNREFSAQLYGQRHVVLDFLQAVPGTLCTANCFSTFLVDRFVVPPPNDFTSMAPIRVNTQTNVVTAGNVEVANGLFGIPVNSSSPARFYFTFADPAGRDINWSVLFNPGAYPGTSFVTVTRTAACTWTIETPAGAQGGLRAWAVLKGRNNNSDEGRFVMPFALTFTAPNCGA